MKALSLILLLSYLSLSATAQDTLEIAAALLGLDFTNAELDSMRGGVYRNLAAFESMRAVEIDNAIAPAWHFNPLPRNFVPKQGEESIEWQIDEQVTLPDDMADLAYYSVLELAALIKTQQIRAIDLTLFFLDRLERYADTLQCAVQITRDLAMRQARQADLEIEAGLYRGPLHGIPYGAKDLLSQPGYPTTWGAMPYRGQVRSEQATVLQKLEDAGAILVAKLTLGALAMGDVWFGGVTKNPWDLTQGSSGSSAGSASAVVAGLVPFAIGTETRGSIVSPSTRCGATGLRPTFGRVSRHGAMALSWTMDKIGPICRSAVDCAIVFDAIRGSDGNDYSVIDAAFHYTQKSSLSDLRVGYFQNLFAESQWHRSQDSTTLADLTAMGIDLEPVQYEIDLPVAAIGFILTTEAAAAFDDLTRSGADEALVRQIRRAWPNLFRIARYVPAVEYIKANRIRTMLIEEMHALMADYDVIVTPSFGGTQLLTTNLTGQPVVSLPNGFDEAGRPTSITFLGNLFDEGKILSLAEAYQAYTQHDDLRPPHFR